MKKRIGKAILAMGLIFSLWSATANAVVINSDVAPKHVTQEKLQNAKSTDFSLATQINIVNSRLQKTITETTREHLYKFSVSNAGRVSLDMTSYMQYYTISVYDSEGTEIWYTDNNGWNSSLKYRQDVYTIDITAGVYYMKVTGYYSRGGDYNGASIGNYVLKTSFVSASESFGEKNNEFSTATVMNVNDSINGQIAINDNVDIFRFDSATPGCVELDMTSYMKYYSVYIYDSTGKEIWYTEENTWNEDLMKRQDIHKVMLLNGLYYMKVTGDYYRSDYHNSASTGKYVLKTSFVSANESFVEPNNDFATAIALAYNTKVTGQIAQNDRMDIFKLYAPNETELKFIVTSYMKYYTLTVYDSEGKEVWNTDGNEWNENIGYRTDEHKVTLSQGNYYVKVTGYGSSYTDWHPSTGTYILKINQLDSINSASVEKIKNQTYKGSYLTPNVTVKLNGITLTKDIDYVVAYEDNYSVGLAKVTITGIGNYSGEIQTTFKILPKKVTLRKVKNTSKRTATVTWKYDSSVDGYQVYRSTKKAKGFKKIKTLKSGYYSSFQNKKLKKGKTYYYKIRAYKTVNGKKYYSEFSKVKSIKIKK